MKKSKFKIIHQHDIRDCGAACLSMIARHYGGRYSLAQMRDLTKTGVDGTNIAGILEGAEAIGLSSSALSGTEAELRDAIRRKELSLPFIAHTLTEEMTLHFVVVYDCRKETLFLADPSRGRTAVSFDTFFSSWTGYVITFKPADGFQRGVFYKNALLSFLPLLKGNYHRLFLTLLLSVAVSSIGVICALTFRSVIDRMTDNWASDSIGSIGIIFILLIGLYFLQAGLQYWQGYLIAQIAKRLDAAISLQYHDHILDLPLSSISLRQTGDYLSRFSEIPSVRSALTDSVLSLFLNIVMAVVCGIILFSLSRSLFLITLGILALYVVLTLIYRAPLASQSRAEMERHAELQSYLKEAFDGAPTVKAVGAERQVKNTTKTKLLCYLDSATKHRMTALTQTILVAAIELVGTVLIIWLGLELILRDQISIGTLVSFYLLLSYFLEPVKDLIEMQPVIQSTIIAAERLSDILELEKEQLAGAPVALNEEPLLTLHNVVFRYGCGKTVLDHISLTIRKGETVALVGDSGSGKTTLAKLIPRFYLPEKGEIRIGNRSINNIHSEILRQHIVYVPQNTFLFSDTIRNNLSLGNPRVSEEEIVRVCQLCRIDPYIRSLPLGYDTPLEENGMNLSGGQRQRLAIARALLKKPDLLILDEATSQLDTVTDLHIRNALAQWDPSMSCMVIAHRIAAVKDCDRIYVMDDGKITEAGTHEELMCLQKKYFCMYHADCSAV